MMATTIYLILPIIILVILLLTRKGRRDKKRRILATSARPEIEIIFHGIGEQSPYIGAIKTYLRKLRADDPDIYALTDPDDDLRTLPYPADDEETPDLDIANPHGPPLRECQEPDEELQDFVRLGEL